MIQLRNIKRTIKRAVLEPAYAWNAGMKRLKGWLAYKFWNGNSPWPESVTLFLTRRWQPAMQNVRPVGGKRKFQERRSRCHQERTKPGRNCGIPGWYKWFQTEHDSFRRRTVVAQGNRVHYSRIKKRGLHLLIITMVFFWKNSPNWSWNRKLTRSRCPLTAPRKQMTRYEECPACRTCQKRHTKDKRNTEAVEQEISDS